MNLFLDTNAIVKLYHQEVGSDNLVNFLNQYADDLVITISDLTKIEFHSAFLKRVRMNEIELETINEVFSYFDNDLQMLNVVEVNNIIKDFAIKLLDDIAYQFSLRTLDAIQLSTAIIFHQLFPIDYFVSCDKKLLNIASSFFNIFNPVKNNAIL